MLYFRSTPINRVMRLIVEEAAVEEYYNNKDASELIVIQYVNERI
jgi:hypothetical protein